MVTVSHDSFSVPSLFPALESTPTFGAPPSGAALSAAQISSRLPRAASEQESNEGPLEGPSFDKNSHTIRTGRPLEKFNCMSGRFAQGNTIKGFCSFFRHSYVSLEEIPENIFTVKMILLPSTVSFSRYVQCCLCGEAPSDQWCEVKEVEK